MKPADLPICAQTDAQFRIQFAAKSKSWRLHSNESPICVLTGLVTHIYVSWPIYVLTGHPHIYVLTPTHILTGHPLMCLDPYMFFDWSTKNNICFRCFAHTWANHSKEFQSDFILSTFWTHYTTSAPFQIRLYCIFTLCCVIFTFCYSVFTFCYHIVYDSVTGVFHICNVLLICCSRLQYLYLEGASCPLFSQMCPKMHLTWMLHWWGIIDPLKTGLQ